MKQAVCVNFKIKPQHWDRFVQLIKHNAATSLKTEEGCMRFDVCMDGDNPFEIFLYEIYASPKAFEDHLQSEHFRSFDQETFRMVDTKHVKIYRTVN